MLDAVVSFLWADAAGNEVLMDSDGTRPSSFVAGFRPFRFLDGWGIATPDERRATSPACAAPSPSRAADDPRVATIGERVKHGDLVSTMMNQCYEVAATLTIDEAMERLNAQRVPCGVVLSAAELVDDEHAQAIGLFVETRARRRRAVAPAPPPDPLPGHAGRARRPARPVLGEHTDEILAEIGLALTAAATCAPPASSHRSGRLAERLVVRR